LGVVGLGWLLLVAAHAAGHGAWFGHDLNGSRRWSSVALAFVAWEVMTVAMMGPSCLPVARYVAANTLSPPRTVTAFLTGYLATWTAFFVLFALADGFAHTVVGSPPASAHAALITSGIAVGFASVWQLTAFKRKLLRSCRTVGLLAAHGRRADAEATGLGLKHGASCVGSCGPLMLAMLAGGYARLGVMVLVALVAWLEKATRWGRRVARPCAALLAVAAVAYFAAGASGLFVQHPSSESLNRLDVARRWSPLLGPVLPGLSPAAR
jgi:predicted metal-binding membrane protein